MFDILQTIPFIGGFLSVVFPFLIVLGVVVFIHEYGHYIVARWCGIHAEVFSLGFGPVIKSWHDRRGTKWQVSVIPLGGYVKFLGDRDPSSRTDSKAVQRMDEAERGRSFPGATLPRRALTVFAGPAANFLLSIVVFAGLIMYMGIAEKEAVIGSVIDVSDEAFGVRSGDLIVAVNGTPVSSYAEIFQYAIQNDPLGETIYTVERDGSRLDALGPFPFPPLVAGVEPISPASKAGLKEGDVILAVGDTEVHSFTQLRNTIIASKEEAVPLKIWRAGDEITLSITPELRDREAADGGYEQRVSIGVFGGLAFEAVTYTPAPWTALWHGMNRTWAVITASISGIYHMIVGEISVSNLQGPLGIAQISGDTASGGLFDLISLIAVISTAIGLMNLFPIPVLDGGHLVLFGYEAIWGKPPNDRIIQFAMSIGLSFLLLLMVFATYNDIMRL